MVANILIGATLKDFNHMALQGLKAAGKRPEPSSTGLGHDRNISKRENMNLNNWAETILNYTIYLLIEKKTLKHYLSEKSGAPQHLFSHKRVFMYFQVCWLDSCHAAAGHNWGWSSPSICLSSGVPTNNTTAFWTHLGDKTPSRHSEICGLPQGH